MVPMFTQDLFGPAQQRRLRDLCEVPEGEPLLSFADERAAALLADAEILLTGWGSPTVDGHVLDQAPCLRAVVHAAGTVKMHLIDAVWDRGLLVSSAAAANAVPVAEFTLAAILFSNKRVFRLQRHYREQRYFQLWSAVAPGLGNLGKTVGIVGASRIGRRVIELLRPFDFEVLVSDPYLEPAAAERLGARKVELDALLQSCDVVSLHAPALPETRHLLDRGRLSMLRDGATLINTARGWLVDDAALEDELRSGRIDAVLDTTEPEILPESSPLYDLPNVFLTPHIAGAQGTETQRMADLALDEIERLIRGEPLQHQIRHEDLARIA